MSPLAQRVVQLQAISAAQSIVARDCADEYRATGDVFDLHLAVQMQRLAAVSHERAANTLDLLHTGRVS